MRAEKKATITAAPNARSKDKKSFRIMSTVRSVFRSGRKVTAQELNTITGSNDARKQISMLRREGWPISDIKLKGGKKLYWLDPARSQFELFREGGEV